MNSNGILIVDLDDKEDPNVAMILKGYGEGYDKGYAEGVADGMREVFRVLGGKKE